MEPDSPLGFFHFVTHTDEVGLALLATMGLMSVLSWTVIVSRLRRAFWGGLRNRRFKRQFEHATDWPTLRQAAHHCAQHTAFARLVEATQHALGPASEGRLPSADAVLARSLQQQLDDEVTKLESGQTTLASIASSAPFVGLFGTVWGIYHALIKIGQTGQSSLDQVAGPVGEALIMTACGLAVAIPAGLAYNVFQRQLRLQIAELDRFANALVLRLSASQSPA